MTRHQIIELMKRGGKLHMHYIDGEPTFWLQALHARKVEAETAWRMLARGDVVSAGDTLFADVLPQTFILA